MVYLDSSHRYNRKNNILVLNMNIQRLKEVIIEEFSLVESITKRFTKAVEAYRTIQLKQQDLRKKFVSEKDPKKKEALKQALISLHKKVQKAESDFNAALRSEPIEDDLTEKSKGLWANIHAKRKRGEKGARKGSKAYKKAKKAADDINKSEGLTEARLSSQQNKALDNMNDWLPKGKEEEYLEILNQERTPAMIKFLSRNADLGVLYKKYKVRGKRDMAALASELMNEGKLAEANQYRDVSDKFKDALDNLPDKKFTMKNIKDLIKKTKQKRPDAAMAYAKDAFGWIGGGKWLKEGKLNEDVFKSFLGDDPAFKLYTATNTDKRKSVQARKTDKTWDDGVPVLKYIARAPKKDSPLPKGKFKIIEDNKYGWWYYQVGRTWYGIQQKDYGTPPFEY